MAGRAGGAWAAGAPGVAKHQEAMVCTGTEAGEAVKTKPTRIHFLINLKFSRKLLFEKEDLEERSKENLQRAQSIVVDGLTAAWEEFSEYSVLINTIRKSFRTSR